MNITDYYSKHLVYFDKKAYIFIFCFVHFSLHSIDKNRKIHYLYIINIMEGLT